MVQLKTALEDATSWRGHADTKKSAGFRAPNPEIATVKFLAR